MEYKLGITKSIHWDEEGIYKVHPNCIIKWEITAEIYPVIKENQLPIIIVAHPVISDNGTIIFTSILHTNAILRFDRDEDPINDIIRMWDVCYSQELIKFKEMGKETIIDNIKLEEIEHTCIKTAHRLRDAAIERKLLNKK